jgi:glucosamine--fructose-6-phosphate aminotransferase (isomerizing)
MCGIFGFVDVQGFPGHNTALKHAVRSLIRLSEPRGREATGLALILPDEIAVYRRAMAPGRVLAHPEFQQFLDTALPSALPPSAPAALPPATSSRSASVAQAEVAVLGHCRLVTNGSQALEVNNQPVLHDRLVGVHNGIVTNAEGLLAGGASGGSHAQFDLDSEALFRRIAGDLSNHGDLAAALRGTFRDLEGEASIAMFARDENELVLATNAGCLYFASAQDGRAFVFASEAHIVRSFLQAAPLASGNDGVHHLAAGQALRINITTGTRTEIALNGAAGASPPASPNSASTPRDRSPVRDRPLVDRTHPHASLRLCTKCILPATYPFISFDAEGVCNYCHEHVTQRVRGRDALMAELARFRRDDGTPDCIVAFSGGRDSSYGLHLLKTELGMTPLAFTYDWGLVTDLARRNQARMCGALGVEHVIRAANIPEQRRYIRHNIAAWLARPRLGMIPLFMAGDKFFYSHARDLRRETGIDLVVFSAGNELERTPFKTGFAGVKENNYSNRLFGLAASKKAQLAAYYGREFILNPRYLNDSLVNSAKSFYSTFVGVDDFLYLYNYEPWNEDTINDTLIGRYGWEISPYSSNTWRIGDGYTAFINYIYHRVAGFSEFDVFRSHQIRDGVIDRAKALTLVADDNQPRLDELREFARLIGFNLEEVLSHIDEIPRIPPRV